MVESYEYLGCIVNEHMHCREMVRERAMVHGERCNECLAMEV